MRTPLLAVLSAALLFFLFAPPPAAQTAPDPAPLAEIMQIKAFDNHAHPWRAVNEGEVDNEWDALIPDALEDQPLPLRLRPDNAEYIAAWRALYGYKYDDMSAAHLAELRALKQRVARAQGDRYPAWVLDQLNIATMNANRVAMGRGLSAPRYLWVSYVDALLIPLSNEAQKRTTPDFRAFYPPEERLLQRYLADLQINALPAKLDDYLSRVVTPTLERQRRAGAIAVRSEAVSRRPLAFATPPAEVARRVYAQYVRGGEPPPDEYRALQDYIFRYIAREAGRLGLAVHFHTGAGVGGYFNVNGSNPMLLEPLFDDPTLRKTNFGLFNGGWPFARQPPALFTTPNVYADFSAQTFLLYPRDLSETIRAWLE